MAYLVGQVCAELVLDEVADQHTMAILVDGIHD